jgi:hypothetical protein
MVLEVCSDVDIPRQPRRAIGFRLTRQLHPTRGGSHPRRLLARAHAHDHGSAPPQRLAHANRTGSRVVPTGVGIARLHTPWHPARAHVPANTYTRTESSVGASASANARLAISTPRRVHLVGMLHIHEHRIRVRQPRRSLDKSVVVNRPNGCGRFRGATLPVSAPIHQIHHSR